MALEALPEPIVTRWDWDSWLHAAEYYATNLVKVCEIVNSFHGDSIIVRRVKRSSERSHACTIAGTNSKRIYICIPKLISKLESPKCTLWLQLTMILTTFTLISKTVYTSASTSTSVWLKNFDMRAIVKMKRPDIAPAVYDQIQCCQPTSAAVERSFSMLGKLLSKDRYFMPTNVERYLCLHFN